MPKNCWFTVGFRQESKCSACGKPGKHREVRFNASGIPTPCLWVHICDECWKGDDKWETTALAFPPEKSRQVPLFYG